MVHLSVCVVNWKFFSWTELTFPGPAQHQLLSHMLSALITTTIWAEGPVPISQVNSGGSLRPNITESMRMRGKMLRGLLASHASALSTLSEKVPCCPPQLSSSKVLFSFPATATQLQLAVIQPEKSLLIHISNIFFTLHHHHYYHHYHHEQKSHHHHHHHHHHRDHHHHSQHNQYRHLPFIEWTPWSTHCGSDVDLGLGTNKPLTHIHSLNPQNNPAWCISFHISTLWTRKLKLQEVKALAPGHSSGRIWVQNASFLLPRHLIHAIPNWLNSTPGSSAELFHEIIKQMFLLY